MCRSKRANNMLKYHFPVQIPAYAKKITFFQQVIDVSFGTFYSRSYITTFFLVNLASSGK